MSTRDFPCAASLLRFRIPRLAEPWMHALLSNARMGWMSPENSVSRKTAVSKPELQRLLADLPFVRTYGFRVHSIRSGECVLTVPFQQAFERPGGIVSGLVFMAAADVAMWLAIKTLLGCDDGCVTAEMKTSFLAAAKRQDFRCRARILKLGKRLVYGVAECFSHDRKLLTHHTLTYIRPGADGGR
jgi:acyl-coenzyme A thioesterase PaaI-like protein